LSALMTVDIDGIRKRRRGGSPKVDQQSHINVKIKRRGTKSEI